MSITVKLPIEIETSFTLQARLKGVPVDEFVRDYLIQHGPHIVPEDLSAEEFDLLMEEAADLIPAHIPPIPEEALRRENLYTREEGMI